MVQHKAHHENSKPRTADISIDEETYFSLMLLPSPILEGLTKCGYKKPSPIQKEALPFVKCGMDLIIQAKAGTGKTCVFTIAALALCKPEISCLQAIILAPTREIAQQITEVICAVGQACKGLKTCCFVGGYALSDDEKNVPNCHIAVGTPGRVRHLISLGILKTKTVKLFVLDEADKLLDGKFVGDINAVFSSLPESKQVLACSATYTPEMVETIQNYMHNGMYISPRHTVGGRTVLLGVRQFAGIIPYHVNKLARFELKQRYLLHLLRTIKFNQCIVFSNYHSRAMSVCKMLRGEDLSVEWIAGCQDQGARVLALSQLKEQRVRVLVTTDLTARGIDAENVNFVINLDVPFDNQTYLHRMGRAGRYGTHGMVITIVFEGDNQMELQKILGAIGGTSQCVSRVPENLTEVDIWEVPDDDLEKLYGVDFSANGDSSIDCHRAESVEVLVQENGDIQECEEILKPECNGNSSHKLESCSCNIFEAKPEYIESIVNPSLFSVSKKMDSWRDVLPLEVYEHKLPLNTPVVLLGTKIIRVRNWEKIYERADISIKETESGVIKYETENIEKEIFDFKELLNIFEYEDSEEDCPEVEIPLETAITEESSEDSSDGESSIKSFNKGIYSNNELQFTNEKCKNVQEILNKYETNLLRLNSSMSAFEFVDIVGWMAVDENHKILNDLKTLEIDLFQFDLIKCVSGKNHIIVSPFSKDSCSQENKKGENEILTLDLENLELSPPYSLASIAQKLNEKKIELIPENKLVDETVGINSNKNYQKDNKELVQANGIGITAAPKTNKDRWDLSSLKKNITKLETSSTTKKKVPSPCMKQNGDKSRCDARNRSSSKQTGRVTNQKFTNKKALSKQNTKNASDKRQYEMHSKVEKVNSTSNIKISGRTEILEKSSRNSSESTDETDTSSLSVSLFKSASEMNSSESEASGPYVNMSQNLKKWQELHNNEESDTDSNSDSERNPGETRKPKNTDESSSGTTRSEEMLLGARRKEPNVSVHHQRKSKEKLNRKTKSDSDDTACSHRYLYQTPHFENYGRTRDFSSSYSQCENSIDNQIQSTAYQAHQRIFETENKQRKPVKNKINNVPSRENKRSESMFDTNQYSTSSRTSENIYNNGTNRSSSEWFHNWYLGVRQRAEQIAYVEYIKAMSTL